MIDAEFAAQTLGRIALIEESVKIQTGILSKLMDDIDTLETENKKMEKVICDLKIKIYGRE
jgi:hypothetical protein